MEELKQIELSRTDIIYLGLLTKRIDELGEKIREIYVGER